MAVSRLAKDTNNHAVQALGLGTVQTVSVSGTSAATSSNVDTRCTVIRVVCTCNCHLRIAVSGSQTATTSDSYLPAGAVEYFRVTQADGPKKVALIQATGASGGTAYITEMI